jgi:predicted CXXCH cytochrome family protein
MRRIGIAVLILALNLGATVSLAGIVDTKHNLSSLGPGTIKADTDGRLCVFCHAPHRASAVQGMLWNRNDSTASYLPYDSTTMNIPVVQPNADGSSKLCLSCHDGTVALGEVLSEPSAISMAGGVTTMPAGSGGLLDTDLRDDHPISFVYDTDLVIANPELNDPATLTGNVGLDAQSRVQCISCHDPHDSTLPFFLVETRQFSTLCTECHDRTGWDLSEHATSLSTWSGVPPDPWPRSPWTSVSENACENCHQPHSSFATQWIVSSLFEEDVCLVCHSGEVASVDILTDITKISHHPVELVAGEHDPNEDPTLGMVEHVECTDCHNAHQVQNTGAVASAPDVSELLLNVDGVDTTGVYVSNAAYQYEVCYKCHADNSMSNPLVTRMITENNKRIQFDPGNDSYHPVEAPGVNPEVPSLIAPWTTASMIYCTDCHAGNTGVKGPHGSDNDHILERPYSMLDDFEPPPDDMCYKCHSESVLKATISVVHNKHIPKTSCGTCHDPHGVDAVDGLDHSHLINFDTTIVTPNRDGDLYYQDNCPPGTGFCGACALECHRHRHKPSTY